MTHMDDELRRALRRVDPPHGFAERVRTRLEPAAPMRTRPKPAAPKRPKGAKAGWTMAAALAIAVGGGGMWYRAQEQRRMQGEEAKRQVLLSLNIASSKLRAIEMRVNRAQEPRQ
jgi:uncharacterized protein HemX